MAALVDVPIFARGTAYRTPSSAPPWCWCGCWPRSRSAPSSGLLCDRLGYRVTTLFGMGLATAMFVLMGAWTASSMGPGLRPSDPVLVACGLGFGLAIAPINAAILGAVAELRHGLAASLVVVARMVGMLVGISLLTAIGLHQYDQVVQSIPQCPGGALSCPAYDAATQNALLDELRTIFQPAAAVCTGLAGVLGAVMLRRGRKRTASAMQAALGA